MGIWDYCILEIYPNYYNIIIINFKVIIFPFYTWNIIYYSQKLNDSLIVDKKS